ncbi:hypothetical protein HY620_01990 [Candidatus Uhrbacteria bacterium]|nr:hypothetical protein [Candidatus Uhrbacteria bacterium]
MSQNNGEYGVTNDEIMDYLKEHMVTRSEFNDLKKEIDELRYNLSQLSVEVKEFVLELRRKDGEIATLNARCYELEKKVAFLEQKLQTA